MQDQSVYLEKHVKMEVDQAENELVAANNTVNGLQPEAASSLSGCSENPTTSTSIEPVVKSKEKADKMVAQGESVPVGVLKTISPASNTVNEEVPSTSASHREDAEVCYFVIT